MFIGADYWVAGIAGQKFSIKYAIDADRQEINVPCYSQFLMKNIERGWILMSVSILQLSN